MKLSLSSTFYLALLTVVFSTMVSTSPLFSQSRSIDTTTLKQEFNAFSEEDRKRIQDVLASIGMYQSEIDGKWGRGTSQAVTSALSLMELYLIGREINEISEDAVLVLHILKNYRLGQYLLETTTFELEESYTLDGWHAKEKTDSCVDWVHGTQEQCETVQFWQSANGMCRGGSGDEPTTDMWCSVRTSVSDILEAQDFCYGKEGDAGYQKRWHKCEANSLR